MPATSAERARSRRGFPGLDWLNFFVADFQTSFGPFVSVYLTRTGWTQSTIGAALTIPALVALNSLGEADRAPPSLHAGATGPPIVGFVTDRKLIAFAACAASFHLANAAMLPITAAAVTKRAASLVIAACIVGPQLVTALLSPWTGRAAEAWGRRPVLFLGYSSLPIRGILLAYATDPYLIIAIQLFDGFSAAAFGVLFPLIVADVTRETGHYTTSQGLVGLAIDGGAPLSTAAAGVVADHIGVGGALLSLAAVGLCATLLVWSLMPETRLFTERQCR